MNSEIQNDVLIVGAGIAGLALGLALARAGRRVQVIDARPAQASAPRSDGAYAQRVYALSPANVAWLNELQVWPALDATRATPVYDMRVFGDMAPPAVLASWPGGGDPAEPAQAKGGLHLSAYRSGIGELCWIVEEPELLRVLEAAAGFAANLSVLRPAEPAALLQNAQGAQLRLADGRMLGARLVVACDGANSWVRSAAGIETDVIEYGQTGVVMNFHTEKPHHNCAYQWFRREEDESAGVLAWLPLPAQQVSMVWSVTEARAKALMAMPHEALAEAAAQAGGQQLGKFTPAGAPAGFPLKNLRARALIAARVALVGDAAHVIHPLAGQGLNLGLADARALAESLQGRRDCGEFLALRSYERARKAAILEMHAVTHGLTRLFAPAHPALRAVRNIGLHLTGALPALPRLIARHAIR